MAPRAWLLLCALHGAPSALLWKWGDGAAQTLAWRAAQWTSSPWTLWTSAWVHLNTTHLVGNLIALGAIAVLGGIARPGAPAVTAWLLSWPALQLSLLAWPGIAQAVGLSGVLHAGVAVLALHLLWGTAPVPHARGWGALILLGLLGKLLLEQGWSHPLVGDPERGLVVVQAAHLAGALWGGVLGAVAGAVVASGRRG